MTNHKFEKRIQEKLDQFEIEPTESTLENIFEKRAARSRRVFRFTYTQSGIALVSILILTAIAVFWPFSGNNSGKSGFNAAVENSSDKGVVEKQNPVQPHNGNIAADKELQHQIRSSDPNTSFAENKGKNQNSEENQSAVIGNVKKDHPQSRGKNPAIRRNKTIAMNNSLTNKKGSGKKAGKSGAREEYNDNGNNIEERYFNIDAGNRPLIASVENQGNSHLMVYHSVDKQRLEDMDLNYLFIKPMHAMPRSYNEDEQLALLNCKKVKSVGKNRKPVFIDVMYTPFITYHQVSDNNTLEGNYNALAKSTYNKQISARVSYPLTDKINIFSGLGYTRLSTDFNGDITSTEQAKRFESVTSYINDPILGTISYTTIETIQYEKTEKTGYNFSNSYKIFSLPVGLSYNFGYRNFDFALNGSALFNLYTNSTGSNVDFVNHQTETFQSDKKHMGLGGGLGFMVAYKLTNKFKFIIEPNLQYYKINNQSTGNVVNQKVLNSGLNIGLRYTVF